MQIDYCDDFFFCMAADRALIGMRCEIRKRHVPKKVGRLAFLRPPSKFANGMDKGRPVADFFFSDGVSMVGCGGIGMHDFTMEACSCTETISNLTILPIARCCHFLNPFSRAFGFANWL